MPDRGLGARVRGLSASYIQTASQAAGQAGGQAGRQRDRFARTQMCARTETLLKWAGRSVSLNPGSGAVNPPGTRSFQEHDKKLALNPKPKDILPLLLCLFDHRFLNNEGRAYANQVLRQTVKDTGPAG